LEIKRGSKTYITLGKEILVCYTIGRLITGLEGGYLGAPTLWRPLNIFLIKGKRIPVKVKEVAVVVIEDEE